MQLLNLTHTQLLDLPERLQTSLQDIVHQVQIESYHCIKHPEYKSLELPESVISRFEQLPLEIQNRHLTKQLSGFLYSVYYNGSQTVAIANDAQDKNWVNDTTFGIDFDFYERLHSRNKSEGYWSHDWLVIKEERDGNLVVHKNGLNLHIERDIYLSPADKMATVGNLVAIKMPKNLVQNGFYMAISNAGYQDHLDITRIYFNLIPEGSVELMESLTARLNAISISFCFKALYNPSDYRRYDSAVLYFNKQHYPVVHQVLKSVYFENQSYFLENVPLFTKLLAPGLACAEEPQKKFTQQESFGTNRCQIIANGLINAWHQGNDTPEGRMMSIFQSFLSEGISLKYPYLNANSEDIYTPL
ncbi:T3SS effector HopA1 family protein [Cronbergia sp. UHCC 0137]|uniref:T3SS effector HopA1 family protein n=1 Tax=Cronbergia sp. UHCC 0137 TaxID=3110239 RepID=UPI002B21F89E|nr:T3SS effector HopA1 family protein [Cronbergia sp. UHCC 0137]MEA5618827.1 T3SS effector HopA1 family protein [Cronbergia sp. UHCC 0137]